MVTFVAECEKKSLNRTRRVLDAFANRIGSRSWQTVITNEGLHAVKKLLRKTASKNTAVSCHWIRSRSRSELVWIVGNRKKFNSEGMVPVNYTDAIIMIGENDVMIDKYYANSRSQRLDQHLFAVGYVAKALAARLVPDNKSLGDAVLLAGCWHDIGKIDSPFQEWLHKKLKKSGVESVPEEGEHIDKQSGKFSWQTHPRHNEISLLLFHLLFDKNEINDDSYNRAKHAIYWHHAKPLRKKPIKEMVGIFDKLEGFEKNYTTWIDTINATLQSIQNMIDSYCDDEVKIDAISFPKVDDIEYSLESSGEALPDYKRYTEKSSIDKYSNNIKYNSLNNIARSILITADRLVSQLSGDELSDLIDGNTLHEIIDPLFYKDRGLKNEIQSCLDYFHNNKPDIERNRAQSMAAKNLADEEVAVGVLKGAAGCGKTKIALEWALNTEAKKIFWVCPRVQICEGLFNDLQSKEYLPNSKLEICTGEIKQTLDNGVIRKTTEGSEFSGEVIITTIDQIINSITTHRNVTTLVSFMDSHVVFDEYHEYINMPAFNLLFAELVECKKQQQQGDKTLPNTLLVSATPNPLFVENFLKIPNGDIEGVESFNQSRYRIEFVEYDAKSEDDSNPLYQPQPDSTIVISNTAITAQKSFIDNQAQENSILLHSKFINSDREEIFRKVFNTFKRNGNREYDLLRSGPIVQASLNITCDKMVSEMTHAENFLQRLGRLDRFGENSEINSYLIAITEKVKAGKQSDSSARFLNSLHTLQSTKAWYQFLDAELDDGAVTINQLYGLYDQFYQNDNYRTLVEQDLVAALKNSVGRISLKLMDPVTYPTKKRAENKIKIKKNSLRGDSRFVQMVVCDIHSRSDYNILDKYAYSEDNIEESLSYSVDIICGSGDSDKNLLTFMKNKHHNIKDGIKKSYKDSQLLNEARDPETPIYLSYTPKDLKQVESKSHPYAIYYAQGIKQPIGAISMSQFTIN